LTGRGVSRTIFFCNQEFDFCEITGIDISDNPRKKGGNLVARIQEKADAERIATVRNAVIVVRSATHYCLKSLLETGRTMPPIAEAVTMLYTLSALPVD
jgi:hypothetical protein